MGIAVLIMGIIYLGGWLFLGVLTQDIGGNQGEGWEICWKSMPICGLVMLIWTASIYEESCIYIGWLPHLILSTMPFLNGLITYIFYSIITNLRSTGRLRRIGDHHSERLAIVMEDKRWRDIVSNIMLWEQTYYEQIIAYQRICRKLNMRIRYKLIFNIDQFRIWHHNCEPNYLKLRIYHRHRLILSIDKGGKIIYADHNYLPDWATFPTIIEQATERLHEQTQILQGKLDDRTYQQHQDKQSYEDYIAALADVFIDKT